MANNAMVIGLVVVVVAIVAAGALFMSMNGSKSTSGNIVSTTTPAATTSTGSSNNGATGSSTSGATTSVSSSGNTSVTVNESSGPSCSTVGGIFTNTGGGSGQSYMSKSEIAQLTFSGGVYCSAGPLGSADMAQFMGGGYVPTAFESNITSMWMMFYNNSNLNPTASISVIEMVYQSPIAQSIYGNVTGELMQGYGGTSSVGGTSPTPVLNATVNGMTYFYVNSTGYYNTTTFIGVKGNEIAAVDVYGMAVNQAQLASTVAGDLP